MKQVMTVFRYTFQEAVRKKSFKVSSIVLLAAIVLIFVLIAAFSGTGADTEADAAPGSTTSTNSPSSPAGRTRFPKRWAPRSRRRTPRSMRT